MATTEITPELKPFCGEITTMDRTGDTKLIWDRRKDEEVSAARQLFDSLRRKGYAAFNVRGEKGEKGEQIRSFDPEAERIIMAPPMVGG